MAGHRVVDGKRLDWRGVDRFRLEGGKIKEEHMDTAPLRAARTGTFNEPLLRL